MRTFMLGAAAAAGLFGLASVATAADDKYPYPDKYPHPDKKAYAAYPKAVEHCKDNYYDNYLIVKLKKGKYYVSFHSRAYTPYQPHHYYYTKLEPVYIKYTYYKYEVEKPIHEEEKGVIYIDYDKEVKIYFKDDYCKDNKGYGIVVFKYSDYKKDDKKYKESELLK